MENEIQNKEVITFYSFKGGTGRTMALANLAVLMSRLGKKILLVDWDLEAPGLHRYFANYITLRPQQLNGHPGLIDFFEEIKERMDKIFPQKKDLNSEEIYTILNEANFKDYVIDTELQGISILKAGSFTNDYPKKISLFQWEVFFQKASTFFQIFCDFLKKSYDFVLVDSRTGFTDTSGICTMLMPEKLCLVFTPNTQSLEGVVSLARKALEYRMNSNDFRPLKIYPIPSRVELAEKDLRDQWRKGFIKKYQVISGTKVFINDANSNIDESLVNQEMKVEGFQPAFEKIFSEFYGIDNCDLSRYFDEIQIHHEPKFSYGEDIAVLNETFSDRLSLSSVYSKIFEKILFEPKIYTERIKETEKQNKISVYISSSNDSKDISFVKDLKRELERTNMFLIKTMQPDIFSAGEDYLKTIEENLVNSQIFLPIITKNYLDSQWGNFELFSTSRNIKSQPLNMTIPVFLDDISTLRYSSHLLNRLNGINAQDYLKSGEIEEITMEIIKLILINKPDLIRRST